MTTLLPLSTAPSLSPESLAALRALCSGRSEGFLHRLPGTRLWVVDGYESETGGTVSEGVRYALAHAGLLWRPMDETVWVLTDKGRRAYEAGGLR